jgi:hypothetical protein
MAKFIMLFFIVLIFSCKNKNQRQTSVVVGSGINNYQKSNNLDPQSLNKECLRVIDSLKVNRLIEKMKWIAYCMYCDDTIKFRDSTNAFKTYGMMPILLEKVDVRNKDTIEIYFNFYNNDTQLNFQNTFPPIPCYAFLLSISLDSALCEIGGPEGIYVCHVDRKIKKDRFLYPLQPEVIKFIHSHFYKLDPWFREQAIMRRIVDTPLPNNE